MHARLTQLVKSVTVKSRILTVVGKRGSITKNFRHAPVEIEKVKMDDAKRKGDYIRLRKWFGRKGDAAAASTLRGIIHGMFVGVTEVSTAVLLPQGFSALSC